MGVPETMDLIATMEEIAAPMDLELKRVSEFTELEREHHIT